jgi:hypothetical protein
MTALEMLSIPVTLDKMQMLFWRLDLVKRSFLNLNTCSVGVLGRQNYRFFKDSEYREKLLLPDDRYMLEQAMNSFRDRVPVRVVFRVGCEDNIYWFKLTGWPTEDRRYYEGAVEDISEHIIRLKNVFDHQDQRLMQIKDASYPIALFRQGHSNELIDANQGFRKLLKITPKSKRKYCLKDLVAERSHFPQFLEQVLSQRSLQTKLFLKLPSCQKIEVTCQLDYFVHENQACIRLAIVSPIPQSEMALVKKQLSEGRREVQQLCKELASCESIMTMLDCIYAAKGLFPGMDVVMYSDIYARKNKVIVYSQGDLNDPLEMGTQFPYIGTIAENIEKENLEYLIVDDTQSSIKAIDWVLFVPKGLYSYVAKAFYVRGAMRTVLILCSKNKNAFSEAQVDSVEAISKAFHQQLKQIRKKEKKDK